MWINKTTKKVHTCRKKMYPWTVTRCYASQCPNHLVVSCLDMHARHTYIRIKTHLRKYKSCQALQSGIIRYKNLTPFFVVVVAFFKSLQEETRQETFSEERMWGAWPDRTRMFVGELHIHIFTLYIR